MLLVNDAHLLRPVIREPWHITKPFFLHDLFYACYCALKQAFVFLLEPSGVVFLAEFLRRFPAGFKAYYPPPVIDV